MASYIPNITDYIPQTQPFHPDLNFYSNVLQTKQAQLNQGIAKVSNIYAGVLNSELSREDNNTRRDDFLKLIEQDIKKVSGLDLSKQNNVDAANQVFQPFLDDRYIVHDMNYTHAFKNQIQKANNLKDCIDPKKCKERYWDTGIQAMQYALQDYKNAGADDALGYNAPEFVGKVDVMEQGMQMLKDKGFNVEQDYIKGGYKITDKNGTLLYNNGSLQSYLNATLGSDPSVAKMLKTQAMVSRRNATEQLAQANGITVPEAEALYVQQATLRDTKVVEKSSAVYTDNYNQAKAQLETLQKKYLGKTPIPNSRDAVAIQMLQEQLPTLAQANDNAKQNINTIKVAPNAVDIKQMLNYVDNITANAMLSGMLDNVAKTYAFGNASRKMDEDQFAVINAQGANSIHVNRVKLEDEIRQKVRLDELGLLNVSAGGKKQSAEVKKTTAEQKKELIVAGIDASQMGTEEVNTFYNKLISEGVAVETPLTTGGGVYGSTYTNNAEVIVDLHKQVDTKAYGVVENVLSSIKSAYNNTQSPLSKEAKSATEANLAEILKGTGLKPVDILSNGANIKNIVSTLGGITVNKVANNSNSFIQTPGTPWSAGVNKDVANDYYRDQIALRTTQENLTNSVKAAVKQELVSDKLNMGAGKMSLTDGGRKARVLKYINKDGWLNSYESAKKQAGTEFDDISESEFNDLRSTIANKIPSVNSGTNNETATKGTAPKNARRFELDSSSPLNEKNVATQLLTGFRKNTSAFVVAPAGTVNLNEIQNDETSQKIVEDYFSKIAKNAGSGKDMGFTLDVLTTGTMMMGKDKVNPKTVYTIKLTDDGAKELFGKAYKAGQNYSYVIATDVQTDPVKYAERVKLSPANVALATKGASLKIPIVDGFAELTNIGNNQLSVVLNMPMYKDGVYDPNYKREPVIETLSGKTVDQIIKNNIEISKYAKQVVTAKHNATQ